MKKKHKDTDTDLAPYRLTWPRVSVLPVSEDEGGEVDTVHGGAAPVGQPGRAAPQDLVTERKSGLHWH